MSCKKVTLVIVLTIFSMLLVPSSYCESDSGGIIELAILDQYKQTTDPTYQVYIYPADPYTDIMYPFYTISYYRIYIRWSSDVSSTEIVVRDKLRVDLGIKRDDFKLFVNWYSYEEHPGVKLYFNETSGDLEVRIYPQIIGVRTWYPGENKGIVHILLQCNITRKLSEIFSITPKMRIVPNFIIKGRRQNVFCMITSFKLKTENNLFYIHKGIYLHSDSMSKPITTIPSPSSYVVMPPTYPRPPQLCYTLYRHWLRWIYIANPLEGEYALSEYYNPVMAIWNVNATKEAYIVNGITATYMGNGGDIPTTIRDKNAKCQIQFDGKDELKLAHSYIDSHQLNMPIGYVLSQFSVYVLQKIKVYEANESPRPPI